jgi:hypothetical protein
MNCELTLTQSIKMLKNLSDILDKGAQHADAKKFEVGVLLSSRLAPDQFDFIRQIQIACDSVKLGFARLAGKEAQAPSHPDTEKTLPELKARLEATATYLKTFNTKDFSEAATRRITQPRWEGKYMTGEEFLDQYVVPNFYFHITTAYAILRNNGVDIGKKDFLGALPFKK